MKKLFPHRMFATLHQTPPHCGKSRPKRGRTSSWWWRITNEWGVTTKIATVYTKNEPNRSVIKCGVDTPSEPNSEIPTYPLERRRVNRNNKTSIKGEKRGIPPQTKNLGPHAPSKLPVQWLPAWPTPKSNPNPKNLEPVPTCVRRCDVNHEMP